MKNGHYLVADEYGPSIYEFDATGKQVRAFTTPANLIPKTQAALSIMSTAAQRSRPAARITAASKG